jgi:hypothetical protein
MRKLIACMLVAAMVTACSETKYIIVSQDEFDGFRSAGISIQEKQPEPSVNFQQAAFTEESGPGNWEKVEEYLLATGYLATLIVMLVLGAD